MKKQAALADTRGYRCPITTAMVSRTMHGIDDGDILEVRFDDEAMAKEIEEWCAETGNRIVEKTDHGDHRTFLIEKGAGFNAETILERIRFILTGVRLHAAKFFLPLFGRRKVNYLVTFVSIPEGLRADRWLEEKGDKNHIALPVPQNITSHCGVVLGVESRDEAIRKFGLLRENNFGVEDIYLIDSTGSVRIER
ncbi:MAG TPA: DUF3343 domain-containing protein [Spirochaetes bacterium]|nr:DUF3343 domain-containing protein [Spirochaetota bacterium]